MEEDILPIMSQEEYEAMEPGIIKAMLICNMPGCGNVVCNRHCLCVQHWLQLDEGPGVAI